MNFLKITKFLPEIKYFSPVLLGAQPACFVPKQPNTRCFSHAIIADFGVSEKLLQSSTSSCTNLKCMVNFQQCRNYMRRKTIKRPPTKPFVLGYPGEIDQNLEEIDLSKPKVGYEDIEELNSCDETVKKLFSLQYADGREKKQKRMNVVVDRIKEHPADVASLEYRIAELTVHIRHETKHMLQFRKDKKSKIVLNSRIKIRRRLIEKLRQLDFEKFEWLLQQLKINYIPKMENLKKLGRRELIRRAAKEKYETIKEAKMDELREKLAQQRVIFEEVKKQELENIQKELYDLGIHKEMKSLHDTLQALGLAEKKPPKKSRRHQILMRKFELYKHRREGKKASQ